jgi:membrane fusion protein, multidrug efflux system
MPSLSPFASVARITVLCALALSAPAGCDKGGDGHKKGPPGAKGPHGGKGERAQVLAVETTTIEPASIERHYRTSGTLRAIREAEIVATQLAIIRTMDVEEGDTVEQGQALARLDGRDLKLQAAAAGLTLENLERELGRLESVTREAIALEEVDKQRYAVEEARAAAKLTRHQATQTTVRAPFAGTVVQRYVDQGNLATTSTPLLRIADLSILELQLHVPERDAASVKVGTSVEIELVDHTRFSAEVFRKAPVVDELTGTVKLTVHAQSYPEGAMPGAFARASILVDAREETPSLARSAIFEVEGEPHVYVIVDGKARRRAVELGLQGSERVEVLSGLSGDDVVIADGNAGITEGMPLRRAGAEGKASADKIAGESAGSGRRPGA